MVINSGSTASADEVMNMTGLIFKNYSNLLYNSSLIGFNSSLDQEFTNQVFDTLASYTYIDQTNSYIRDSPVFGATIMDDFNDDSINATIWTTGGGVTESSGRLNCQSNAGTAAIATANGASAQNFNVAGTILITASRYANDSGGSGASCYISLVDEHGHTVNIKTINANTTEGTANYRFNVSPSTNNVQQFTDDINGDGTGTAVDITSLADGDKWHLKFYTVSSAGGDSSAIRPFFVRYLRNAAVTKDFISTMTTASATITNAILVANSTIGTGATATYYLSADNGVNYEEVTLNKIHRFTNTGTQLILKVSLTNTTTDKVYQLNHWAIIYNLY